MIDVVGVSFKEGGRIYYFSPNGLELKDGMSVVVETERGLQYGSVVIEVKKMKEENLNIPLKRIIREATKEDLNTYKKNVEDCKEAFETCKKLIKRQSLNMTLIDANFTLDRQQLLFRFSAEERIDFRKLVKELASIYKTRIELRQIGVRDKAGEVGGIGPCGRLLCCSRFLYSFDMVSINMAKNQNIALNPSKINGSCGRLLCCLTYENDAYTKAKAGMPAVGVIIETENGKGRVTSVDILSRTYKVEIENYGPLIVELGINDKK